MRRGFANSTSSRWNAYASELTSSWPSKFSKEKLILTRLNSSSADHKPVYEGTPTDYCKDQAAFDEGAVPSLSGQTSSTSYLVSFYLQKNSWTVIGPKSSLQPLCYFCIHSLTFFSILLPLTIYVSLTPKTRLVYVVITGPRGNCLPLINKIKKSKMLSVRKHTIAPHCQGIKNS